MHGAVTQRSSPGLNAAQFLDGSLHSALWSSDALAKNLGFQRRQWERYVPRKQKSTKTFFIKADVTINGSGWHIAPLQPESPTGQFLIELLQSHPHLLATAAEQQLDKLAEDRSVTEAKESSGSSSDLVLYKRIAELKAQERRTTVEEILYALVSHRFLEAHISLVPKIPIFKDNERVDNWPTQEKELQSVHSTEALEMVWEHLAFILGVKGATKGLDDSIMVQISKFHMGQVYATSALYGYFLRRVDEKFQMEKILLPPAPKSNKSKRQASDVKLQENKDDAFAREMLATLSAIFGFDDLRQEVDFSSSGQSKNLLRSYLLSFEADTLYRCATVRSTESACIIERHTAALFGKPEEFDVSEVTGKEVAMILSLPGLRRLVLEAVAFGSFLWDVETLVDSHYTIVAPD
ncbi:hypothetical protein L7F22_061087 [Adiantum nelumboides]|nr:hypothetical protein [Adiantum nelumboides]